MKRLRIWFDPPTFSWGRVLRIGGLWAAVVLAVALPITRMAPEPPRATPRFSETAPTAVAAARAVAPGVPAAVLETPSGAASAATSAHSDVQVCGGLRVPVAADGTPDLSGISGPEADRARQALLANLRGSGEPWLAAAAMFIETMNGRVPAICSEPGCPTGEAPRSRTAVLQALARMAEASSDPRIHAIAMSACGGVASGDPACKRLSTERWAQLDPFNAVPWMFVAAEAQTGHDSHRLDQAMQRIAQAWNSDTGWGLLPGELAAHAPPAEAALPAVMKLVHEVIGVQSAALLPPYAPVHAYCGEEALREPGRRELCDDIAQVLVAKSTAMTDRVVGLGLATRLGWPAARLETLRKDIEAVTKVSATEMPGGVEMLSCEGGRRTLAHLVEVGRAGEMEAGLRAFSRCCAAPPPPR